jgi:hypothetical protein
MSTYSPDQFVSSNDQDHFQRYQFAERIARTIYEDSSEEGLVIGIYGKWGEGKTSVLKFIESEVEKNQKTIIVHFNPWLFGDEKSLITTFFEALAKALEAKLYTKRERFFGFLKTNEPLFEGAPDLINDIFEYGKASAGLVGSVTGFAGSASKIIKGKSEVSLETLKTRIENLLIKSKKRILIVVDDIDRLDSEEIRAIFRLVKLTAHFKFTTYVLAFDDAYVARILSKSFGDTDSITGYSYLEKIVQVPLRLPLAMKADMETYCMNKLGDIVHEYSLEQGDLDRLYNMVINGLLPALQTPRMVIRFTNACSFSLPLMDRLVNHVDLIIIEGIKISYPSLYSFLSQNRKSLISSPGSRIVTMSKDYHDDFKRQLNDVTKDLPASATELVVDIFPEVRKILGWEPKSSQDNVPNFDAEMRICSNHFFDRYFSYSVAKGDLSEIVLADKIDSFNDKREDNSMVLKGLFDEYGTPEVLSKLELRQGKLIDKLAEKLFRAMIDLAHYFPRDIDEQAPFRLPGKAADLILIIIHRLPKNSHSQLIQEAVLKSNPLEFGFSIMRSIQRFNKSGLLDFPKYLDPLKTLFLHEMIAITDSTELVGRLPLDSRHLLAFWKESDKAGLDTYIQNLIQVNPEQIVRLIKAFTPYRIESYANNIAFINFGQDNYIEMKGIVNVGTVAERIMSHYGSFYSHPKYVMIDDVFEINKDKTLLTQFMAIHSGTGQNSRIKT